MIAKFFHRWEQRLANVSRHERVVRPFEWGLDWMASHEVAGMADSRAEYPSSGSDHLNQSNDAHARIRRWVADVMRDTDTFFT
ncbi:MAG: hypothetical protein OEW19_22100, partial [Acidobacteriota bacterium]|nr:hypothetical protein [Acidobacteriota bacterium]